MTTSEHADHTLHDKLRVIFSTDYDSVGHRVAAVEAALASTPSPAQPTGLAAFWPHHIAPPVPSPVQGADDRLAQLRETADEWAAKNYLLTKALMEAEAVIERIRAVDDDDPTTYIDLPALLATHQQSPQAALNEVRAGALEDAAEMFDQRYFSTREDGDEGHYLQAHNRNKVQRWLRARAAELRAETNQTRGE